MNNTSTHLIKIVFGAIIIAAVVLFGVARSHAPRPQPSVELVDTISYVCDASMSIEAMYFPESGVALKLSDGRSMNLPQTISASGVRYADSGESFVFWSKGNGALVLENNEEKSYKGCIRVAPEPAGSGLSQAYVNSAMKFSIRLPEGYVPDESYVYQALSPSTGIAGVKFAIPTSLAEETNLSADSYVSVEEIPRTLECSASLFSYPRVTVVPMAEGDREYSVASSSNAGVGNRYNETVYAVSGTNPCLAIRYFIHYGVIQNYPEGFIKEFDEQALLAQFDQIRRTLVINQ